MEEVSPTTCQISSFSTDENISASFNEDGLYYNRLQAFSISDVEMGVKPLTETFSSSSSQRLRRVVEVSDFMKDIVHKLCLRDNLLILDRSKFFYSDKDPGSFQIGCEYYIFALRHILI